MDNSLGMKIFNHNCCFMLTWALESDYQNQDDPGRMDIACRNQPQSDHHSINYEKSFILVCDSHTIISDTIHFDSNISFLEKSYLNRGVIIKLMNARWHKLYICRAIGANYIQKITGSWKYDPESMTFFIRIQSRIIFVFITSFLSYIYLNYIWFWRRFVCNIRNYGPEDTKVIFREDMEGVFNERFS